jgi:hypothetical protein
LGGIAPPAQWRAKPQPRRVPLADAVPAAATAEPNPAEVQEFMTGENTEHYLNFTEDVSDITGGV